MTDEQIVSIDVAVGGDREAFAAFLRLVARAEAAEAELRYWRQKRDETRDAAVQRADRLAAALREIVLADVDVSEGGKAYWPSFSGLLQNIAAAALSGEDA